MDDKLYFFERSSLMEVSLAVKTCDGCNDGKENVMDVME